MIRIQCFCWGLWGAILLCLLGGAREVKAQSTPPGLEEQIGQMLMVGFEGLEVGPGHPILRDIRDYHLGGILLFDTNLNDRSRPRNIRNAGQLRKLVADLQAASDRPLLVAVDQEGGRVQRLKPRYGFPPTESARQLGEADNLLRTRRQAAMIARTLDEMGINLNLAPVVDLDVNPENPVIGGLRRSFGADPALVIRHARAFIEEHHRAGVLCTLKHFPGHGSAAGDTHLDLVDVTGSWSPRELQPFAALIEAGLADAVMTAHIFHAGLDERFPATLSKQVVTGMLRNRLQFDGVVLSDDLQMGAITRHFGLATALRQAIDAGVDVLVLADHRGNLVPKAVALIRQMVARGELSEARIHQSYARIKALKERLKGRNGEGK